MQITEIDPELMTKLIQSQTLINMAVIMCLVSFAVAMAAETLRVISVIIKNIKTKEKRKK